MGDSLVEEACILVGRVSEAEDAGGREYRVWIGDVLPVRIRDAHESGLAFRHETWTDAAAGLDPCEPEQIVVGWLHTHVGGVRAFFSETDRWTQRHFFRQPWQVGLVYDPLNRELKGFAGPGSRPMRRESIAVPALLCLDVDGLLTDGADGAPPGMLEGSPRDEPSLVQEEAELEGAFALVPVHAVRDRHTA